MFATALLRAQDKGQRPKLGEFVHVAGPPEIGKFATPQMEAVDFSVWQARDGTWQAWSCIRKTAEPGATRLFHRWEGKSLTSGAWEPMGVAMRADPAFGERQGSMQAPHVLKIGEEYRMFYTSGGRLFLAVSEDGKSFMRKMTAPGRFGLFGGEDKAAEAKVIGGAGRDIMILRDGARWIAYYTSNPDGLGKVYARVSPDLKTWSDPVVVAFGGEAGTGPYTAECPFVIKPDGSSRYLLFRTQRYTNPPETRAYSSRDPLMFGIEDDSMLVAKLPVAAPEIAREGGAYYIACLTPQLDGLRVAKITFE